MRRINATLPALGMVSIDFYKESESVLTLFDEREMARLRGVPHLGVASTVFTGANHSRLEYTFLQCAVIGLVAKLHRLNAQFALSNDVTVPKIKRLVSSGEELLKIWALLGNYGRMQYTYGVERGLLQTAYKDENIKKWLVDSCKIPDLRRWVKNVIEKYQDRNFHYVISILRISQLPEHDRRKRLFVHYIRCLVLSPEELAPGNASQIYKLARLQQLYSRIRLLTMVAIDSHYSHAPFSINLSSAILGLANFAPSPLSGSRGFDEVISNAAGMLADELYLHPSAVACQRDYELKVGRGIEKRLSSGFSSGEAKSVVMELATKGIGRPSASNLKSLVRLSFRRTRRQLLGVSETFFDSMRQLEHELAPHAGIRVAIDRNNFTGVTHIDVLYAPKKCSITEIALTYSRLQHWLVRTLEADALLSIRNMYAPSSRKGAADVLLNWRQRYVDRRLKGHAYLLQSIFLGVLSYLLPENKNISWPEIRSEVMERAHVLYRIRDSDQNLYDEVEPLLQEQLDINPRNYSIERLQEIRCLLQLVGASPANFLLVCMERFHVCDESGRVVDEWDGAMLEIYRDRIVLKVIEVKTGGTAAQRERDALIQLRDTRKLVRSRHSITYRTKRIQGMGAMIEFTVPTT